MDAMDNNIYLADDGRSREVGAGLSVSDGGGGGFKLETDDGNGDGDDYAKLIISTTHLLI